MRFTNLTVLFFNLESEQIGYAIALKLLRMGAIVIVTTRFPHDAASRYAAELDAESFKGRLHVYGLDFRDIRMLHHFTGHIKRTFTRLDVIINNAAQTVRKPPAFYAHLMDVEMQGVDENVRKIAKVVEAVKETTSGACGFRVAGEKHVDMSDGGLLLGAGAVVPEISGAASVDAAAEQGVATGGTIAVVTSTSVGAPGSVMYNVSASMSQVALLETDQTTSAAAFPPGLYDRDDQQIDLREVNSWNLEMGQISTMEMVECHTINSFAPWVLISELKPLMVATQGPPEGVIPQRPSSNKASKTPNATDEEVDNDDGKEELWDRYIVNVSAMEGQFYRNKTIFHPHTNMAKASLNMMTRTAAAGFAEQGIYMTCSDTGWITDENPVSQWSKREHQPPPLDEYDAAMRVLDPVLSGVRGEARIWGVFLKNYRPTRW
jgi:NAD(P)-dependent dehydrogenase (short-subunit alcohol dehydrogenase family)